MLPADLHLHSTVSFDGHNSRREMALAARDRGIRTICFTDHYDVVNEKNEFVPVYDWTPARREHAEAKAALGGSAELLYGLELGNAPADFSAAAAALTEPGLDFVLGSIHNASKAMGWQDYYYVNFESPERCYAYLDDYFDQEEQLVQWGNFDSLAHLPYPLRYMSGRDGQPVTLGRYEERIVEILRKLIQNGKALEVNSGKSPRIMPEYGWLLERYADLGGELVTVGCDAHRVEDVGVGLEQAYDLLKSKGYRYVTVFRGRRPCPTKL
ncbi:MAG: PHP domain-containing protein [Candidatus Onthomonas sp.]|nr:PHP domain-containing protein [Candidatus Onthomonas sp.]